MVRLEIYRNFAHFFPPPPLVTVSASVCANASVMNEDETESPLFGRTPLNWLTKQLFCWGYRCGYFIYKRDFFKVV